MSLRLTSNCPIKNYKPYPIFRFTGSHEFSLNPHHLREKTNHAVTSFAMIEFNYHEINCKTKTIRALIKVLNKELSALLD